jgi:ABC-2 type transport system permease protein
MPPVLAAELRKLTTVRGPWLLLAVGPVIVLAGVSGLAVSGTGLASPATVSRAFAHVGLAAVFTLAFGLGAVAGEHRHGTSTDTYLSFPRRREVILAKLAVYAVTGAAAGLVSAATALLATWAWWSAKGAALPLAAAGAGATLAGGVAVNVLFAVIGVGLGALIRNLAVAVAAALAWIAVAEVVVAQLTGSGLARWLPLRASEALDRASPGGTGLLPAWGGGLVLAGYAAAFALAAVFTALSRDVT